MERKIIFLFCLLIYSQFSFGQYELRTKYGSTEEADYVTGGIFVVWWDKKYDKLTEAEEMLNTLAEVREICLSMGMEDPPGPDDGFYFNIYMQHGSEDIYPDEWGLGVGTDSEGYPYFTAGSGPSTTDLYHEGFHIFQYNANSSGFPYSGNSGWFIEASAEWFTWTHFPDELRSFGTVSSFEALPYLKMWRTYGNGVSGEPDNWQRLVRQYAYGSLLYYLTEEKGIDRTFITESFYSNIDISPQEYLVQEISDFRTIYADWTAHNAANFDFDFISRAQYESSIDGLFQHGDADDYKPIIKEFNDEGTGCEWYQPQDDVITQGWSYNVYQINNTSQDSYTFSLDGDKTNEYEDKFYFQGRVVKLNESGDISYSALEMSNDQDGSLTLEVEPSDTTLYFVVTAMADWYDHDDLYPYKVRIEKGASSSCPEVLSIAEYEPIQFGPNPTSANINVWSNKVKELRIFDFSGKQEGVLSVDFSTEIDVSFLRNGIHLIEGLDANGNRVFNQKLIKKD